MSSKSYEENQEWEKQMRPKINKIYVEKMDFDIISRQGEREYDLIMRYRKTLQKYTVEEKIIRHVYPYLSIELIQDIESCNLGWIYKCKADLFHWIMCENEEPKMIYAVVFPAFRKWYLENCKKYSPDTFRIEPEGFGVTLHQLIPSQDIPNIKIIKV